MILLYLVIGLSLSVATDPPKSDCGINYRCFQPEKCDNNVANYSPGKLTEISSGGLNPDCFVSLKFHPYSKYWYEVILEGKGEKIELLKDTAEGKKAIFTCQKDGGNIFASYEGDKNIPKMINSSSYSGKVKCEFEINFQAKATKIFTLDDNEKVIAVVKSGGAEIMTTGAAIYIDAFCLPNAFLMPKGKVEASKKYGKVQYKLGDVFCKQQDIFKTIEFREEDGEEYELLDSIFCNKEKPYYVLKKNISGVERHLTEEIDVRCVADAEYFCDYDLMPTPNQTPLKRDKPDLNSNPPKKGEIKCPDSHPFFVIRGQLPVRNANITCQNHNGKMKWTYNGNVLSATGPQVHCTNKLECHVMNPITKANLDKTSFLNTAFEPSCDEGGELKVKDDNSQPDNKVIAVRCNEATGEYYYQATNGTREYERPLKTAVFSCTYPTEKAEKIKEQQKASILLATVIPVGVPFIIVFGIISTYVFVKDRKMKKLNKELEKADVQNRKEFDVNFNNEKICSKDSVDYNDYLMRKREEAKACIRYNTLPGKVPVLDRRRERITPAIDANKGQRIGGITKFVNYKMESNKDLKAAADNLCEPLDVAKPETKSSNSKT